MEKGNILRNIPKVDEVLNDQRLFLFLENTPRELIVESVREEIAELRKTILNCIEKEQLLSEELFTYASMMDKIIDRLTVKKEKSLRRTINATGVSLHTNLGRAKLSKAACDAVFEIASNYSTLEYDVKKGARGHRHNHIEGIITKITGAEAAMAVNNNAAATMLCLSSMAFGKEVVVSRGELVEIGGSFRVPEIMEQSGAVLHEVGTTNKTKKEDYNKAINENTGALLKVHTSNYKIVGFTAETTIKELSDLGKEKDLPVIYDMGSGLMMDMQKYGIPEPTVEKAIKDGADVVLFSGDKLLGGPQAGIIIGKKKYIEAMKKHPLARILRLDKMTLAALEATFSAYINPENAIKEIPTLAMITRSAEELKNCAENMQAELVSRTKSFNAEVIKVNDLVGGGTTPTTTLLGYGIGVSSQNITIEKLERLLRENHIPIIARIIKEQLVIDVRTITEEEAEMIIDAFIKIESTL